MSFEWPAFSWSVLLLLATHLQKMSRLLQIETACRRTTAVHHHAGQVPHLSSSAARVSQGSRSEMLADSSACATSSNAGVC